MQKSALFVTLNSQKYKGLILSGWYLKKKTDTNSKCFVSVFFFFHLIDLRLLEDGVLWVCSGVAISRVSQSTNEGGMNGKEWRTLQGVRFSISEVVMYCWSSSTLTDADTWDIWNFLPGEVFSFFICFKLNGAWENYLHPLHFICLIIFYSPATENNYSAFMWTVWQKIK